MNPNPSALQNQTVVMIFLKNMAAPILLFSENPIALYEDLKKVIEKANPQAPKLIERPGTGPLKKVSFLDTQLSGVALQSP